MMVRKRFQFPTGLYLWLSHYENYEIMANTTSNKEKLVLVVKLLFSPLTLSTGSQISSDLRFIPRASAVVGLGWGLGICIANKVPNAYPAGPRRIL